MMNKKGLAISQVVLMIQKRGLFCPSKIREIERILQVLGMVSFAFISEELEW
jgi:hypothetical protein